MEKGDGGGGGVLFDLNRYLSSFLYRESHTVVS